MREQLDTPATLREAAHALRDFAAVGEGTGMGVPTTASARERARNLAKRLDALADATHHVNREPVAWTSEAGLHNLASQRARGLQYWDLRVRVDQPEPYNDRPLYTSPAVP